MQIIRVPEVKHTSYNTGTPTLPDISALTPGHTVSEDIVHIYISGKTLTPVL